MNPRPVHFMLGGTAIELETDIRKWYSGKEQILRFEIPVPAAGEYETGLWLPDGSEILRNREEYSIRCANPLNFRNGINEFGIKISI